MRRNRVLAASAALVLALGMGLSGCTDGGEATSEPESQQSEVQDGPVVNTDPDSELPTIKGGFGEVPEMTPTDAEPPQEITRETLVKGDADGAVVGADDIVTVNYAGFLWDGTPFDSSFSRNAPATFSLNSVIQGWKYGLADTKVGDRVLLIVPPEYGYGAAGQGDIPGDSTLVFVVDIVGVYGSDTTALEEATPTTNPLPEGMLVEGDLGSAPRVVFEESVEAPTVEETIVLAEGNGPVITSSDTVVYHYLGTYWGSTENAASTWDTGAQVIEAGDSLFLGEKVGSRLAMVFPGDGAQQPAMVMVVDILAAYAN